MCYIAGVEDLENFHGKALGDKGTEIIAHLEKQIVNQSHDLRPGTVTDDAPALCKGPVKLSQPPNYKLGDKVRMGTRANQESVLTVFHLVTDYYLLYFKWVVPLNLLY